jgi:predicted ester cyclase
MRQLSIAALCAVTFTATTVRSEPMSNPQIVRSIYEVSMNQNQPKLLETLFSPDYTGPEGERGPAGFQSIVDGLKAGFPDVQFKIDELISEGDRVVVRWSWEGTHRGQFRGNAPTGKRIRSIGVSIYTLKNGKVMSTWVLPDRLGFFDQLDMLPANLKPKAPPPR